MKGRELHIFPTSLWWSGNAVRLRASYSATGVYFRQPQSEKPVLQSLMMWGGDRAVLWQVSACVCVCVFLRVWTSEYESTLQDNWMRFYASETWCVRKEIKLLCFKHNETIFAESLSRREHLTTSLGRLCRSSKGLSRVLVSTFRMTTSSSDRLRTLYKSKCAVLSAPSQIKSQISKNHSMPNNIIKHSWWISVFNSSKTEHIV